MGELSEITRVLRIERVRRVRCQREMKMEGRRLPQTNGWRLLQEVDKDKEVAFPLWPPEGMYPADSLTVAH